MKRLRFFFRVTPDGSAPVTDEYSSAERRRFLNGFRPIAQRHRRRKLISVLLLIAPLLGIIVFGATFMTDATRVICGFGLLATCWLISIVILAFGLKLRCPACRKRLEPAKGLYCPVCGSDQYQCGINRRGPPEARYPYCPACDCTIDEASGDDPRSYSIRGCTHCGVLLDEKGL